MEFGVYIRAGVTYQGMLDLTRLAEQLDYSSVFLNDHVHGFRKKGKENYLEAWTAMSAIGVQTSTIRIGHIVLFNSLRNPAFLAKSIASIDNMTDGRYEIMIGAGWNKPEYEGYDLMEGGRGMPSAKERVDRFEESLKIIRGMLTHEEFSYEGKFWQLKNAYNIPQPVQNPIRISVGASKPRMLRIAAELADGVNLTGGLDSIKKRLKILQTVFEKNNKSINDYFLSGFSTFKLAEDQSIYDELIAQESKQRQKKEIEIREHAFIGTSDILVEKLIKARDLGMKLMIIIPDGNLTLDKIKGQLERFHDNVMSNL